MNTGLDVRVAIRDANDVFGRFPARMSLPLVFLGLLSTTVVEWIRPDKPSPDNLLPFFLGLMLSLFISFWLNCFVQVVVSSMYLRAQESAEPGAKQFGEAWQYRGLASLAGGLLLRYIGWTLLLGVIFFVVGFIAIAILGLGHMLAAPASGIGATAGGVGHGFGIGVVMIMVAAFVIVAAIVLCRYMFIFPMFAIVRGADRGFLDECVARTTKVWKIVALVTFAAMIPVFLIFGIEKLVWKYMMPPHGVHVAIQLVGAVIIGCYSTWLILVKTGLAMQLITTPAAEIEPIEDGAAI